MDARAHPRQQTYRSIALAAVSITGAGVAQDVEGAAQGVEETVAADLFRMVDIALLVVVVVDTGSGQSGGSQGDDSEDGATGVHFGTGFWIRYCFGR
jgi:hypothetical protein